MSMRASQSGAGYLVATAISAQVPNAAVSGGNTRGANAVDWQTLRGAANQVASGVASVVGGGSNNLANATTSTVAGGNANLVTGTNGAVAGGNTNRVDGNSSWCPGGQHSSSRGLVGRGAWAADRIAAPGDVQCGEHHLLRQTADATAGLRLTGVSGAAANATNTLNLPDFSAYSGVLTVVAKATGSTAAAVWRVSVSAVRGSGVGSVVLMEGTGAAIVPTVSNGLGSAWRLDLAADLTNGGISVAVTGAAATTINWSARYSDVEVTTAS